MGCNQSSELDTGADPFRERRNRLRDSRKRGTGPSNPSASTRRAAANATTEAADQAIRANKSAFPSSRDIPGFVNPLAGITAEQLAAGMADANPSFGATMTAGNTSTAATNAATLGLGEDGYFPTDAITTDDDHDAKPKTTDGKPSADHHAVSADSIGRLADVPENDEDEPSAPHRRHGMDEHAHPSLDTANTNNLLPNSNNDNNNNNDNTKIRVAANASTRSQRTGLLLPAAHIASHPHFEPEASAVIDPPTVTSNTLNDEQHTAHRTVAVPLDDIDAVLQGSPDSSPVLTVVTLTMHRRRLRALAAASTPSYEGPADAARDPMAEWLDEVITVTIRAPHLRVKIVEETF